MGRKSATEQHAIYNKQGLIDVSIKDLGPNTVSDEVVVETSHPIDEHDSATLEEHFDKHEDSEEHHPNTVQPGTPAPQNKLFGLGSETLKKDNALQATFPLSHKAKVLIEDVVQKLLLESKKLRENNESFPTKLQSVYNQDLMDNLLDVLDHLKTTLSTREEIELTLSNTVDTLSDTASSSYKQVESLVETLQTLIGQIRRNEELFFKAVRDNAAVDKRLNEIQASIDRLEDTLTATKDAMPSARTIIGIQETLRTIQATIAPVNPHHPRGRHEAPTHGEGTDPRRQVQPRPAVIEFCTLCSGPHWLTKCTDYKTSQARKIRAREVNVCWHCGKFFEPDAYGTHVGCLRATTQCGHCSKTVDYDESLHHPSFCSTKSREREARAATLLAQQLEREQSRKRALDESTLTEQDPVKKAMPPARPPLALQPPVFQARPRETRGRGGKGGRGGRGTYAAATRGPHTPPI